MAWTLPATINVGDPATASWMNTYVRDNLNWLYGDVAWSGPGTFSNGWLDAGDSGYRRIGTQVEFRGSIVSGNTGDMAFNLPVGYRPTIDRRFRVVDFTDFTTPIPDNSCHILIVGVASGLGSPGDVIPYSSADGDIIMLDGVHFSII